MIHDIQRLLFQMWIKDYQETSPMSTGLLGNKLCLLYVFDIFCTVHFRIFSNYLKSRLYVYPKCCVSACYVIPQHQSSLMQVMANTLIGFTMDI